MTKQEGKARCSVKNLPSFLPANDNCDANRSDKDQHSLSVLFHHFLPLCCIGKQSRRTVDIAMIGSYDSVFPRGREKKERNPFIGSFYSQGRGGKRGHLESPFWCDFLCNVSCLFFGLCLIRRLPIKSAKRKGMAANSTYFIYARTRYRETHFHSSSSFPFYDSFTQSFTLHETEEKEKGRKRRRRKKKQLIFESGQNRKGLFLPYEIFGEI